MHSSTASRALTGATDRPVNPETRDRVIAVAARLGYQPNAMARSLKTASAGAIGMLVPSLRNPFWSQMMRAVVRRASERELVVLVAEDTGDEATEKAYERLLASARIDGLIVTSASARSSLPARVIASGAPCVFAGRGVAGSGRNVRLAEEPVSELAVEHFAALGHVRIGTRHGARRRERHHRAPRGRLSRVRPRHAASRRASSGALSTKPGARPRRSACSLPGRPRQRSS